MMLSYINKPLYNLRAILVLLLISLLPIKSLGQGFDWVYATKGLIGLTDGTDFYRSTRIKSMVTTSSKEIYIVGDYIGKIDFGDGQQEIVFEEQLSGGFLIKLDENKNIIWVKSWNKGGQYVFTSITLDEDENIFISGNALVGSTQLFLNPNPPNPAYPEILTPTHENLSSDKKYGYVMKLDANGNYLNSNMYEGIVLFDTAKDSDNNIIAIGCTLTAHEYFVDPYLMEITQKWGYITKLDANLNVIWDKMFDNNTSSSSNMFIDLVIDSQDNIYCSGKFRYDFIFNSSTLQQSADAGITSKFICKFLPDGTENWIVELRDYAVTDMNIDASDSIYFAASYEDVTPVQFNNTTINTLPETEGFGYNSVLFKTDVNGNHIWNVPIYGLGEDELKKFTINSLGQIIVPVKLPAFNELFYGNEDITIEANNSSFILLKVKPDGTLIDFKRLFENTSGNQVQTLSITTDVDDSVFIGGYFRTATDFDPHFFNEYVLTADLFENWMGVFVSELRGFVLKLKRCDVVPLFNDTYEFCGGTTPNPTIGDIQPKALNIKWYLSSTSPTPLNDSFAIIDGQTYYYENIVESCPNFDRLPVEMNILPPPPPPIIDEVQPCFVSSLTLADLNITGENLAFYATLVGDAIADSTGIIPDKIYYVSQTIGFCESQRIAVIISDYFGSSPNQYSIFFCKSNPNDVTELINISDYNSVFIPAGASESNYVFSYHHSFQDAEGNVNPITNFQNYQATIESVYVRIFSTQSLCFKISELIIDAFNPPIIEKIVTADWSNNNTITVLPNNANYSYSLDGIIYQNSNYFENLRADSYTVFIKNEAGCFGKPEEVYLLNYPKFFTPNGDGYNDLWSINFSQLQDVFNVEIYDRYGKFIISFDKNHSGWDGKYNDIILPATDYWFRITRVSDTEIVYRGHFSLKR